MLRNIEIANSEREVDGVDVFERCDEVRNVRQGVRNRQHPESGSNHQRGSASDRRACVDRRGVAMLDRT